jgi:poly(hydroxyalkanoate) depolymerase family esterase
MSTSLLPGIAHAATEPADGALTTGTYQNTAGTLSYQLYVPASYQPGTAVPLVVALHGCTQNADKFRKLSQFDALAAKHDFIVVYPEQSKDANSLGCWNWYTSAHVIRGAGEPSMIAGLTTTLQQTYSIDAKRTYVTGLSAGGAMATVMGTTYPDLYAAVGIGSGCEYTGGAACAGYKSDDPNAAGKRAYAAMGAYARVVPFMVFQGDQDKTVPPVNADQLVQAQQVASDYADDGQKNGSIPQRPAKTTTGRSDGGRSYTTRYYSEGHEHELGQYVTVRGMAHAWSGGAASEQYSDPAGPDESALMYAFFMDHPMGDPGPKLPTGSSLPGLPDGWPTPGQPGGWTPPQLPGLPQLPNLPQLPGLPGWPKKAGA